MLGFLFSFLGVGAAAAAAAAAAGGPSSSGEAEQTAPKEPQVVAPPPSFEHKDVGHDHGDMGHEDEEPAHDHADRGHEDEEPAHDHADRGHEGEEPAHDHADRGHEDEKPAHDHADRGHEDEEPAHDHADRGHEDHGGMGSAPIALPTNAAEVNAFVAAVRASPETHAHGDNASKMGEHMAAMDLVSRDDATHIAIAHGDWDNPANWHNGEVPGDDARALIPEGVHMTYDHVSDARLFTVRVDGKLEFATDKDSQMVVDTLVISPSGALEIGTEDDPVDADVNVDIIFANNGAIDTDWDPMLLSRGMVAHGTVDIHGTEKDSHDKVVDDPMAGDTWVDMGKTPEGWAVGDTIVIAGTEYEGYTHWEPSIEYIPPQDETRVITDIKDGMIFFDEPLEYDHDAPREDLKTSVANYTRNVSFETEDADSAEIHERGHVMFMHNDDVDVRYAEFHELGRTDKSEAARNVDEFASIDFDSNVKGRYSFHFHRAGTEDTEDPGMSVGNAVFGSPGWGFVHHDSHAVFDNNASYDTFGAGYVAESGNETGAWTDNIAIFAQGTSWKDPKLGNHVNAFDLGTTGDGFWFQSRMVDSIDNIASSVNNGFVYFHRGPFAQDGQIRFDSEVSEIPGILNYAENLKPDTHPILSFSGNEAQAVNKGLYVVKNVADQNHDVRTVLDDFTAWNVKQGASISYTSHYTLKDFDIIAAEGYNNKAGIAFGSNTSDISVIDANVEGFRYGFVLGHKFTTGDPAEDNQFFLINPTFKDIDRDEISGYNPKLDTIMSHDDIPHLKPDLELDGPLVHNGNQIKITGTKTDSLGEVNFPTGADDFTIDGGLQRSVLEHEGYFSTSDGQDYMMLDLYFSDRLTSDIYMESHPVFLTDNVKRANFEFNGVQDFGGESDPTIDSAILWATLTEGQLVLSDEAIKMQEEEEEAASATADDIL